MSQEDCPMCHCLLEDECECESGAYEDQCEARQDKARDNFVEDN